MKVFIRAAVTLVAVWVLAVSAKIVFPPQGEQEGHSDAGVSLALQEHRLIYSVRTGGGWPRRYAGHFAFCRRYRYRYRRFRGIDAADLGD